MVIRSVVDREILTDSGEADLQKKAGLGEAGVSIVEFSVVLSLFILILVGIIQYGYILATYISVRDISGIAARNAVLSGPDRDSVEVDAAAKKASEPLLDSTRVLATVAGPFPYMTAAGETIMLKEVVVTYQLPVFFSFIVPGTDPNGFLELKTTVHIQ